MKTKALEILIVVVILLIMVALVVGCKNEVELQDRWQSALNTLQEDVAKVHKDMNELWLLNDKILNEDE